MHFNESERQMPFSNTWLNSDSLNKNECASVVGAMVKPDMIFVNALVNCTCECPQNWTF